MIPGLDVMQIPDEGILFDQVAVFGTSVIHSLIMGPLRVRHHAVNVQESDDDALDSERNVASILSNDGLVGSWTEVKSPQSNLLSPLLSRQVAVFNSVLT